MYLYHCEGWFGVNTLVYSCGNTCSALSCMLSVLLLWMYTLCTLYCLISNDMFYIQMQLIAVTESMEWIYMYVCMYVLLCDRHNTIYCTYHYILYITLYIVHNTIYCTYHYILYISLYIVHNTIYCTYHYIFLLFC
jgi:hypothetical protein